MIPELPDAVVIDANGFWWRAWAEDDHWSMVPTNPDNSPVPQPVKFYRLVEFKPGVQLRNPDGERGRPVSARTTAEIVADLRGWTLKRVTDNEAADRLTDLDYAVTMAIRYVMAGGDLAEMARRGQMVFGKRWVTITGVTLRPATAEELE